MTARRLLLPLCAAALCLSTACLLFKRLTPADRLGPQERLDYLVLAAVAPGAARDYLVEPTAARRRDYLAWFWESSGRTAGLPGRETLLERARRARDFFGAVDLFGDDRVKTYIRFGPPRRESYNPVAVRTESLTVIVNPAEIWSYDSLGLQFDFVRRATAYRLVGETEFGAGVTMPSLEEVDAGADAPLPLPGAAPLAVDVSAYRLLQQGDSIEVDIHYGIPVAELARLPADGTPPVIALDLEIRARDGGPPVRVRRWVVPNPEPESTDRRLAVGRLSLFLPVDVYDIGVSAVTRGGEAAGTAACRLNLVDYVRRAQPASDVVFYSLADSILQSPQFSRGAWQRLVPMVARRVPSGRTFYVLYEVYHLGTDEEGRHLVEAEYELIEETTRQSAIVPTPKQASSRLGTTATFVERVHTMDLRPGPYLLVTRVRDVISGRDAALTAQFEITPAGR